MRCDTAGELHLGQVFIKDVADRLGRTDGATKAVEKESGGWARNLFVGAL